MTDSTLNAQQMWIMIAGPYASGARTADERAENLRVMNRAALIILDKGHIPLIGVNLALPMIEVAGLESYDRIMMPLSLAIADRCDAVLRVGGASAGADDEMTRIRERGGVIFDDIDEIPDVRSGDD